MLRKALVIDDAEQTRSDAEEGLQLVGDWETVAVARDLAAVGAAMRHRPDLILLDAGPADEGLAILRGLQAQEALCEIPVVVLTVGPGAGGERDWLRIGAAGLIAKPFDPRTMPVLLFGAMGTLDLAALV